MWQLIVAEKSFGKICRVGDRKKHKTSHVYHMGIARLVSLKSISFFGLLTRTTRSPRLP